MKPFAVALPRSHQQPERLTDGSVRPNVLAVTCLSVIFMSSRVWAAPPLNFESEPINYTSASPDNVVSQLQAAIDQGEKSLPFEDQFGYLRAILKELDVPESSQMLTFLKGSLQRPLIGPENARALYFGDDAYVGTVPGGMLELIVTDPKLGMVFYTLEQTPAAAKFKRQVARCMTCHASSRTMNIPGLQVRSMITDPDGEPVISAGSFRTDHSSPLNKRWGGWFVTGTHGGARHLGNFQLPDKKRPKQPIDNATGANITDLSSLTNLSKHLTPHSDIVALMVFEHQIDAHNLMTRTNYAWQIDQHHHREAADDALWKQEAEKLVQHVLFVNELSLNHPIQGTSSFAQHFAASGPCDSEGRSLRQFNLQTRLFEFPCSFTLQSRMFQQLAQPIRDYLFQQLNSILTESNGKDKSFAHLTAADRTALLHVLPELIPGLKTAWHRQ